jgi:APA family basic amino acid/polyamine antiporter
MLDRKNKIALSIRKAIVPLLTIAFSAFLMTQVNLQQIAIALMLLGVGVPLYTFFSPKSELAELKAKFLSTEAILERTYRQRDTFLAYPVHHVIMLIYRIKRIQRAWHVNE